MTYIRVEKIHPDAQIPTYAHPGEDTGADVRSVEDVLLPAGETRVVKLGFIIQPIGRFVDTQLRSKSGLAAKHSVHVLNSPGTIDMGYRGEMMVILHNAGKKDFQVEKGMKVGQLVALEHYLDLGNKVQTRPVDFKEGKVDRVSDRGEGGFGSTGAK